MSDAREEARKEVRRRLDLLAYRAMGVLQSLHSSGSIPTGNASFVSEIMREHDDLRRKLEEAHVDEKREDAARDSVGDVHDMQIAQGKR